jgi:hypothetical protein
MSFLNLHASQINEIAASLGIKETLAVRVKASPEARIAAVNACEDANIKIPANGAFTQLELDNALDEAFDKAQPLAMNRRLELKAKIYAGGLVLEKSNVDQRVVVTAGLMLKKAKLPMPSDRPYSLAEFDKLLAATQLAPGQKIEIKSACIQAGLVQDEPRRPVPGPLPQTVHAVGVVCGQLGLDVPAGKKLTIGAVDDAMKAKGWDIDRRVRSKALLSSAGLLPA